MAVCPARKRFGWAFSLSVAVYIAEYNPIYDLGLMQGGVLPDILGMMMFPRGSAMPLVAASASNAACAVTR
jgi:hypothetical protein